tara:strand:+ start:243 stop:374 length:132 start_codon:yes stop_codon:yes gene_type:complete
MNFEEYLLHVANGDKQLAMNPEFRRHHAPNWLRYLKEKEYDKS